MGIFRITYQPSPLRVSLSSVASLIYLTTRAPSQLAREVRAVGHRIFEVVSVTEVLYLCETEDVDAIVIGADVEGLDLIEAQMRRVTIKLKPKTTIRDLIWELSHLFPDGTARVQ